MLTILREDRVTRPLYPSFRVRRAKRLRKKAELLRMTPSVRIDPTEDTLASISVRVEGSPEWDARVVTCMAPAQKPPARSCSVG